MGVGAAMGEGAQQAWIGPPTWAVSRPPCGPGMEAVLGLPGRIGAQKWQLPVKQWMAAAPAGLAQTGKVAKCVPHQPVTMAKDKEMCRTGV